MVYQNLLMLSNKQYTILSSLVGNQGFLVEKEKVK